MEVNAHLYNFWLLFEIRMQMLVALVTTRCWYMLHGFKGWQ